MVEDIAVLNPRIISNEKDEITNDREPLYLPSIDNTVQLLCLENACQPLFNHKLFDNRLREKIEMALNRSDTHGLLTLDEQASIYLYTMEWNDAPQNSFYVKLNQTLRTGDENLLEPWLDYLHLFTNALLKLPSIETTVVYRCIEGHVDDHYQEDGTHILLSFISCIMSLEELVQKNISMEQYTVFSIKTSMGKSIDKYGGVKGEILLLPGSRFQVVKVNNSSDVHSIELDETSSELMHRQNMVSQDMEIRQRKHRNQNQQNSANKAVQNNNDQMDITTAGNHRTWWKPETLIIALIISVLALLIFRSLYKNFTISTSDDTVLTKKEQYEELLEDEKKYDRGTLLFPDGSKYEGEMINSMPNGIGIKIWSNGDRYEGKWKNGKFHGHGSFVLSNEEKYVGDWVDDKKDGQGIYVWSNGDQYKGSWKDDEPYGYGILVDYDGDRYEGYWEDKRRNGLGVYIWAAGSQYNGSWKNDEQHGYGIYIYQNGDKYEGDWENNKKNGQGIFTWINGSRYSGSWKDDEEHGKGTYVYDSGDKYEGYWDHGRKNGQGVYTWIDGDRYSGSFENDEQHGEGTYIHHNGAKYEGHWDKGKKDGQGVYTWVTGDRYSGSWQNDQQSGNGTYVYHNGDKYEGHWKNDEKYGQGVFTWIDGNRYIGNWVNDTMHGYGEMHYTDGTIVRCKYVAGVCID